MGALGVADDEGRCDGGGRPLMERRSEDLLLPPEATRRPKGVEPDALVERKDDEADAESRLARDEVEDCDWLSEFERIQCGSCD